MPTKRLMRSKDDRLIGGVCAGIARYFEIDPVLVRLGFALLIVMSVGSPFLIYLALWLIIPLEGREESVGLQALQANMQEIVDKGKDLGNEVRNRISPPPSA